MHIHVVSLSGPYYRAFISSIGIIVLFLFSISPHNLGMSYLMLSKHGFLFFCYSRVAVSLCQWLWVEQFCGPCPDEMFWSSAGPNLSTGSTTDLCFLTSASQCVHHAFRYQTLTFFVLAVYFSCNIALCLFCRCSIVKTMSCWFFSTIVAHTAGDPLTNPTNPVIRVCAMD